MLDSAIWKFGVATVGKFDQEFTIVSSLPKLSKLLKLSRTC